MALIPYREIPGDKDPPIQAGGVALEELYCGDVHCDCGVGHLAIGQVRLTVDLGTGRVDLANGRGIPEVEQLHRELARQMKTMPEVLGRMRAHYGQAREFGVQNHFWFVDWTQIDKDKNKFLQWNDVFRAEQPAMVPMQTKGDLVVEGGEKKEHEERFNLMLYDAYCVNPKCDCHQVVLTLLQGREQTGYNKLGLVMYQMQRKEPRVVEAARGVDPNYLFMTVAAVARDVPTLMDLYEKRYAKLRELIPPLVQRQRLMKLEHGRTMNEMMPGRNDPCVCGSGKKYKKCHGAGQPKALG